MISMKILLSLTVCCKNVTTEKWESQEKYNNTILGTIKALTNITIKIKKSNEYKNNWIICNFELVSNKYCLSFKLTYNFFNVIFYNNSYYQSYDTSYPSLKHNFISEITSIKAVLTTRPLFCRVTAKVY